MKNKKAPLWVSMEIRDMLAQNVDIHDWELVKSFLRSECRLTMLEWILSNRDKYYYIVLSKQYSYVE